MPHSPDSLPARALAVETSSQAGSVALVEGAAVIVERSFSHGLKHAAGMLPLIDQMLRSQGWQVTDLGHLYVSQGPGSFTGLRIGITFAKLLAYTAKSKIVAVPTLRALAENAPDEAVHLIVLLDAKREQIFTARYERLGGLWVEREPAHLDRLPDMLARVPGDVHLLGEGIPFHKKLLPQQQEHIVLTDQQSWTPRASVIAKLGYQLACAGVFTDPDQLVPAYVRIPEAEEKFEQLEKLRSLR